MLILAGSTNGKKRQTVNLEDVGSSPSLPANSWVAQRKSKRLLNARSRFQNSPQEQLGRYSVGVAGKSVKLLLLQLGWFNSATAHKF